MAKESHAEVRRWEDAFVRGKSPLVALGIVILFGCLNIRQHFSNMIGGSLILIIEHINSLINGIIFYLKSAYQHNQPVILQKGVKNYILNSNMKQQCLSMADSLPLFDQCSSAD
jgi:hypothetical protein